MKNKPFSSFSALLVTAFLWSVSTFAASQPNIVFIFSDDQGMGDLSCYGSEIRTPHIDSIAKNGAKFNSFYVAAPVCTPSRFGLLTGKYPARSQDQLLGALMFLDERDDKVGLRTNETTIAEVLQKNGYKTALIGKWHLGHGLSEFSPNKHGFDYTYGTSGGCIDYFTLMYGNKPDWYRNGQPLKEKGYSTDLLTKDAVRYLEEQKSGKPFFLYLAYTAPHYGKGWDKSTKKPTNILQAKDADRERYVSIADKDRREYAGMVTALDDGVGRVLEALKNLKLDKNTLVVFACDNGADPHYGGSNKPFRGQKNQLFEGGIHVPCLAMWPGKIKAGRVINDPIIALDFFPTFCEMAGVKNAGAKSDGVSIEALLFKNEPLKERDLIWQTANGAALRRGDWKYFRSPKEEMLFNLKADPYETNNLATAKPELVQQLKAAHAKVAATFPKKATGR